MGAECKVIFNNNHSHTFVVTWCQMTSYCTPWQPGIPNTLRPRQNGSHFPDDTFKRIVLNVRISIKISLKFVPKGPIINIRALVQIMAWRRPGDKPLSEPMMVSLLTYICVTWPQWVKYAKTMFNVMNRINVTWLCITPMGISMLFFIRHTGRLCINIYGPPCSYSNPKWQ